MWDFLVDLALAIVSKEGILTVVIIGFGVFLAWLAIAIFKTKGWITNPMVEVSKHTEEMVRILQEGFNSKDSVDIIKEFAYGIEISLRNGFLRVLMDIYHNKKEGDDDVLTRKIMKNEFQAVINRIDNKLFKIPNVAQYSMTKSGKMETVMHYADTFIAIMKEEKEEKDVSRRIKRIVDVMILNADGL